MQMSFSLPRPQVWCVETGRLSVRHVCGRPDATRTLVCGTSPAMPSCWQRLLFGCSRQPYGLCVRYIWAVYAICHLCVR